MDLSTVLVIRQRFPTGVPWRTGVLSDASRCAAESWGARLQPVLLMPPLRPSRLPSLPPHLADALWNRKSQVSAVGQKRLGNTVIRNDRF